MTIIIFILILGLLVLVHELGHFVVARRNGITAHEFGFGFPPRILGFYKNDKGKWIFVRGNKDVKAKNTIYSLNWFPIGGFVKIKGEDGSSQDQPDSFAGKSAWIRTKVLLAGVTMNLVLAWVLLSIGFMIGSYEIVPEENTPGSVIMIDVVSSGSPAEAMGLKMGDEIISGKKEDETVFSSVKEVQDFIGSNRGSEIILKIKRGEELLDLKGTPRSESVENQGALGIGLAEVTMVQHSFFESLWLGLVEIWNILVMMGNFFKDLIFGKAENVEVTGIVGIAVITGQIIPLGITALLRFISILSINLAIINALPFPALDGGRVLFILIEKIKGSPVSEKVEQGFHTAGFVLLIALMIVVTFMDVIKNDIIGKVIGIF